ncbi:MAG: tetratricopeptide repeat protein [Bacteroidia bacterium]|nr:tetratricopeptide repeat protein [Bacteroidia bacterium]
MKKYLLTIALFTCISNVYCQKNGVIDSMMLELSSSKEDTNKVQVLADLSEVYNVLNQDSCLYYGNKSLKLARALKYHEGEARGLSDLGLYYRAIGDLPEALKNLLQAQKIATGINNTLETGRCLMGIGLVYQELDADASIRYLKRAKEYISANHKHNPNFIERIDINLGINYMNLNQLDSAYHYLNGLYEKTSPGQMYHSAILNFFGELQIRMGKTEKGIEILNQSASINTKMDDHYTAANTYNALANIYKKLDKQDSAIYFAQKALYESKLVDRKSEILKSANLLAELYEPKNISTAYQYLKIAKDLNETIYGAKKVQGLQQAVMEERERQQKVEEEQLAYTNRLKQYTFFGGILILSVIAFVLYRNNRQKKKTNNQLESSLRNLKSTQSQLIQSEKMASLGELTAGIAHEIQNPLNFVNNFSEVSKELLDEMKMELDNGNMDDAKEIANDVILNLEKINHHGKRADAIVKGMLQHSRSSSGVKEPTDINALADEYLRLAYHGLRAKDKSFNATMKTDYDETIGTIDIIPQDIGRVILNLITNAFYAVNEKKTLRQAQGDSYEPTVTVSTKKLNDKILISVKDNGKGMPQKVLDKIFQPFFTTKPTGQGTGLGLSLSYDIVKAHGGEIKVDTKEGQGTEFIIQLPVV